MKVKKWGLGEEYALCMKTKLNLGILISPQFQGTLAIAGVPIISRQTDDIFLKSRTRNADRNLMMMAARRWGRTPSVLASNEGNEAATPLNSVTLYLLKSVSGIMVFVKCSKSYGR